MTTLQDQIIRQSALDTSKSFIVTAPAGSGKTSMSIQRLLKLLLQCDKPEQILMMTFTKKAAAEIKQRITELLQTSQINKNTYDEQTKQLIQQVIARNNEKEWQLLNNIHRLQIMTIDSFCYDICQRISIKNGQGVFQSPTEQAHKLYRKATENFIQQISSMNNLQVSRETITYQKLQQAYRTLLLHFNCNLEHIANIFSELLSKRELWLPMLLNKKNIKSYFTAYRDSLLAKYKKLIAPHQKELKDIVAIARLHLATSIPKKMAPYTEQQFWIKQFFITQSGDWRKKHNKNNGLPSNEKHTKERLITLIQELKKEPFALALLNDITALPININHHTLIPACALLLPHLVSHLNLLFQEDGCCDFNAIAQATLHSFEHFSSDWDFIIGYRIQHILVDEFQDTSGLQFQLLEKMTETWQEGDGKTLFLVGDSQQSIYSFRNARVGLFLSMIQQKNIGSIRLQHLALSTNFRSQPHLVDWVNNTFCQLFPSEDFPQHNQTKFYPATSGGTHKKQSPVHYALYSEWPLEAEHLVQHVNELLTQGEKDIAILGRQRDDLVPIVENLNRIQIPWRGQKFEKLFHVKPVNYLYSLTTILLSAANRLAWINFLRSPLVGLSASDLFYIICSHRQLANHEGVTSQFYRKEKPAIWLRLQAMAESDLLSAEGKTALAKVLPVIKNALSHVGHVPLCQLVKDCWLSLGGELIGNQADSDHYLNIVSELEHDGYIDIWQLETQLNNTYKSDTNNNASVKVMTMHQAKGLEFDHVFLTNLNKRTKQTSEHLMCWYQPYPFDIPHCPFLLAIRSQIEVNPLFDVVKAINTRHSKFEEIRLLYVACTRARKKLYLYGNLKLKKEPHANSLLQLLWPLHKQHFLPQQNVASTAEKPSISPEQESLLLYRLPKNSRYHYQQRYTDSNNQCDLKPFSVHTTLATYIGKLVHRILKQIVYEGIQVWQPTRLNKQLQIYHQTMANEGFSSKQCAESIAKIKKAITTTLSDSNKYGGRWLLSNHHAHSHCELAIDVATKEGHKKMIIDRCFLYKKILWIIDYKTTSPVKSQEIADFFLSQSKLYKDQLDRYAHSLPQLIHSKKVKKMLYFPLIGKSFIFP